MVVVAVQGAPDTQGGSLLVWWDPGRAALVSEPTTYPNLTVLPIYQALASFVVSYTTCGSRILSSRSRPVKAVFPVICLVHLTDTRWQALWALPPSQIPRGSMAVALTLLRRIFFFTS